MDNLTHSLVGLALARTGLRDHVPGGTVAIVALASLPDLDIIAGLWGRLYYLAYHRGTSHSLAGVAVQAVICSLVMLVIARAKSPPGRYRFWTILAAVSAALFSHPVLDYTNSYGWRPFLPFDGRWVYGDLVFIVDPFLWLILGAGAFLSADRTRAGRFAWLIVALAFAGVTVIVSMREPGLWYVPVLWAAACSLIALLGMRTRGRNRPAVAWLAILGVFVWWGVLAVSKGYTESAVRPEVASHFGAPDYPGIVTTPRPGAPHEWDVLFQDPENIYKAPWSAFSGMLEDFQVIPRKAKDPLVQAALATCPGVLVSHFARFEVFEVLPGPDGPVVRMTDARFLQPGRRPASFGVFEIPLGKNSRVPCPGD